MPQQFERNQDLPVFYEPLICHTFTKLVPAEGDRLQYLHEENNTEKRKKRSSLYYNIGEVFMTRSKDVCFPPLNAPLLSQPESCINLPSLKWQVERELLSGSITSFIENNLILLKLMSQTIRARDPSRSKNAFSHLEHEDTEVKTQ